MAAAAVTPPFTADVAPPFILLADGRAGRASAANVGGEGGCSLEARRVGQPSVATNLLAALLRHTP